MGKAIDMLTPEDVSKLLGVKKERLYAMVDMKLFPRPMMFSPGTRRWIQSDVDSFLSQVRPWMIPNGLPPLPDDSTIPPKMADLVDQLREFPANPGAVVYFLIDGEEVVYVGQTESLGGRIENHRKSGKVFDRVFYMRVSFKDALRIEAAFILRFAPKYNETFPLEPLARRRMAGNS